MIFNKRSPVVPFLFHSPLSFPSSPLVCFSTFHTQIKALDGLNITKIAAGMHHTLCLDKSGRNLYAFGRGDSGQLGTTPTRPPVRHYSDTPLPVSIRSNSNSSDNNDLNSSSNQSTTTATINPPIADIACADNHNFVLTESREVYSWGYGDAGALGHGQDQDEYQPRKLDALVYVNAKRRKEGRKNILKGTIHRVAGGGQHSALIMTTK